jgi:hypothetical protein
MLAAHLFETAAAAAMTAEQRIRGRDADVAFALLATGYDDDAIAGLAGVARDLLDATSAVAATQCLGAYRLAAILTHDEPDSGVRVFA